MDLRRWVWALGACAVLVAAPACQKSERERAADERKDVAEAQKDVREERKDLAQEQRESQGDAARATRDEREDVSDAMAKQRKEESEAASAQGAAAASSGTVDGSVVRASDDALVVKDAGGTPIELKVDSNTSVTVDGRRASMEQVREGAQVRASFERKDGERHALRVELQK